MIQVRTDLPIHEEAFATGTVARGMKLSDAMSPAGKSDFKAQNPTCVDFEKRGPECLDLRRHDDHGCLV